MTWLSEHWLDLFGWVGSALLIVSLLQTRVLRFRLLNLSASVILVTFNALVAVWPMVGMNVATSAINIVFITRMLRNRHSETAYHVLEVGPADAYLRHFLGVHEDDIERHQPTFSADRLGEDDLAFQVQSGDETVGVVLIRAEGEVAQVLLDYVTPRFRDFSPGEFVWRQATRLRDRGFRKVVTPPAMLAPYYDRLPQDWRPVGSAYELRLQPRRPGSQQLWTSRMATASLPHTTGGARPASVRAPTASPTTGSRRVPDRSTEPGPPATRSTCTKGAAYPSTTPARRTTTMLRR